MQATASELTICSPDVETITAQGSPYLENYSFRIIPDT